MRDIVTACRDDEDYPAGHKEKDKSVAAWRGRKERYLAKLRKVADAGVLLSASDLSAAIHRELPQPHRWHRVVAPVP